MAFGDHSARGSTRAQQRLQPHLINYSYFHTALELRLSGSKACGFNYITLFLNKNLNYVHVIKVNLRKYSRKERCNQFLKDLHIK